MGSGFCKLNGHLLNAVSVLSPGLSADKAAADAAATAICTTDLVRKARDGYADMPLPSPPSPPSGEGREKPHQSKSTLLFLLSARRRRSRPLWAGAPSAWAACARGPG